MIMPLSSRTSKFLIDNTEKVKVFNIFVSKFCFYTYIYKALLIIGKTDFIFDNQRTK